MSDFLIKFAIASHVNYYKKTLPVIIPSLLSCDIKKEEIFIFLAGSNIDKKESIDEITHYFLPYNSFECSALIAIAEKELVADYWCLLHDTCKVGSSFKKLVYQIPEERPDKIALRVPTSMSIGCYSYNYLISLIQNLKDIKNEDLTEEGVKRTKQWAVLNEDYILWKTEPKPAIYKGGETVNDWFVVQNENWYGDGLERRTEYFPSLDLYKNKANWGQYSYGDYKVGL